MNRLYVFAASFGIGVLASTALRLSLSYALFALFLSLIIIAYAKLAHAQFEIFIVLPLMLIGLALGVGRMDIATHALPDPLAAATDKKVTVTGLVSEDPDERESYTLLVIDAMAESSKDQNFSSHEKVLASVPIQSHFAYGDLVEIQGKLVRPQNFQTDSGRTFDYVNYLGKDGIRYELTFAQGKIISRNGGNFVTSKLIAIKRAFENAISESIPDPQGALMNGVLLGAKQALGKENLDDFKNAGLAHVVVLSGYNIGVVAKTAEWLFSSLSRTLSLSFGALSIVLFTLMAGATASVLRAALMALLALLSRATRRDLDVLRALLIAGFLMALQNPLIIPYDPSFQLSFIATLGLITVSPIVATRMGLVTERFQLREIVTSTLATQLFVLPFLLYMSGQFSIAAFPANLLVLPFVPTTMLLGVITAFFGFISHSLALLPGFASYGLLSYMLLMTHFFANVPIGSFLIKNFPLWGMGLWYVGYMAIIWWWHARHATAVGKLEKPAPAFDTSLAYEIVN